MATETKINDALESIKRGANLVGNTVRLTLGPCGGNVAIENGDNPIVSNDGIRAARSIKPSNRFEKLGADLVIGVGEDVNTLVGDNTTTAMTLAQEFINVAVSESPMSFRREIKKELDLVISELEKSSRKLTDDDIEGILSTSVESKEIAKLIADTIKSIGRDGEITVDSSPRNIVEVEIVDGARFDRGYLSPYMITNNEKATAEVANVPVLITSKKITSFGELLPLINKIAAQGKKELFIIAEDIDNATLDNFTIHRANGVFSCFAVKAPDFGEKRNSTLSDIATITGGVLIDVQDLKEVGLGELGRVDKVIISKDKTTLIGGKGATIQQKIAELKSQKQDAPGQAKEMLTSRISMLGGKIAVLKVGAPTDTDVKYLKDKIEDALNNIKAAIEEGVVEGGGMALYRVSKKTSNKTLQKVLRAPLLQIIQNAERDPIDIISQFTDTKGYDAENDEIVDLFEKKVIDSFKGMKNALKCAISAATLILTIKASITKKDETTSI